MLAVNFGFERFPAKNDQIADNADMSRQSRTHAKHLSLDPGYVMACVAGERTKSESAKAEWERVARLLGGIAAGVVLALQAGGFSYISAFDIIYIMRI